MLVIAKKEHEADVLGLLPALGDPRRRHRPRHGRRPRAHPRRRRDGRARPGEVLTEPPEYRREGVKPAGLDELQTYDLAFAARHRRLGAGPADANAALLQLLASPEIASKRWIWRQYDHQVLTNTVVGPGSDAAVLRIKEARPARIAVATDGNGAQDLPRPLRRRRDRRRRGRAQRRLHRRPAARRHRLPELRQPGAPRRLLPARGGRARHGRRLRDPRRARRLRQRLALQRVGRRRRSTRRRSSAPSASSKTSSKAVPMGFQGEGDVVYLLGVAPSATDDDVSPARR